MKDKIAFLCKTYRNDYKRVNFLLDSFEKYNRDSIPFYLSIPMRDRSVFHPFKKSFPFLNILFDEEISNNLLSEKEGDFEPGYINQQIVKLEFWEKGLVENYICIDSDTYIIKDFYEKDFILNGIPYSVLQQFEEHFYSPETSHWFDIYQRGIKEINREINFNSEKMITCLNGPILSSIVLEDFAKYFLDENNYTYRDIILKVPFEYSWYSQWLLKSQIIPIYPIPSVFKIFHFRKQYVDYKKNFITEELISKMHIGIGMNSNWYPIPSPLKYKNPTWFRMKLVGLFYRIKLGLIRRIGNVIYRKKL